MPMFDASTVTGISKSEFLGFDQYGEAITDYKTPHVDSPEWFQKNKSREDQHRDLPANGFKLNVAVRYDTLFAGKFPRSTVAKYFLNPLKINYFRKYILVSSNLPKKTTNKMFERISALSSKKPLNQKNKCTSFY